MSDLLVFTILSALLVAGGFTWLFLRKKSVASAPTLVSSDPSSDVSAGSSGDLVLAEMPITFSNLETTPDLSRMIEVRDVELVSRLNAVIPNAMNTVAQFLNKIPKNAVQIDIPFKDLVNSKAVAGAKRAFEMGADGIAKNANVSQISLAKTAQLANIGAGVMNVAALVVGQQLMSEINSKLSELNEGIDRLQGIARAEIKSKILANIAMVMEISSAQLEILENAELRQSKLHSLDEHKKSVIALLGQVNLMIEQEITKPDFRVGSKGFKAYESVVNEISELTSWQSALLALLEQVSKFTHALSLGVMSLEKSNSTYFQYLESSTKVNKRLSLWHGRQIEALQLDIQNGRAAKGVIERLPGFIIQDLKFLNVKEELATSVSKQLNSESVEPSNQVDVFESDVQLVLIDGKYFYKPIETGN